MTRQVGVLLPLFSLPGAYGIGDLGPAAYEAAKKMASAGVKIWQMLPLNPIGYGHSPYQPYSSSAGDTRYISLEKLYEEGLLEKLPDPVPQAPHVNYEAAADFKAVWFHQAFEMFRGQTNGGREDPDYQEFIKAPWVQLYGIYTAFKKANGGAVWTEWPEEMKFWPENRSLDLQPYQAQIQYEIFLQYEFFRQWKALRTYVNGLGIRLMGDMPFYVGQDSQEVWGEKDNFLLDAKGYPTSVAGVPPDYFCATGQRWGNPIYNWEKLEKDHYDFLIRRIQSCGTLFDLVRIDHFRAFDTYWKVPASCPTAVEGEWIEAPGYDFFNTLLPKIPGVEIIAEDLGEMRPEVYELRDHFAFPGMDVLEFTLTDPGFKVKENMVAYTGTHDNDTAKGWLASMEPWQKEQTFERLKELDLEPTEENIGDCLIQAAMLLPCKYVIVPMQDLLGLGTEARINAPGMVNDQNWTWKLTSLEGAEKAFAKLIRLGATKRLAPYFRSVLDQDRAAVVLCNLQHEILYMNPAAVQNYAKRGGEALIGRNLLKCHGEASVQKIQEVLDWFRESPDHNLVFTHKNEKHQRDVYMVALRNEEGDLIGYYEKHESRVWETMKPYDLA